MALAHGIIMQMRGRGFHTRFIMFLIFSRYFICKIFHHRLKTRQAYSSTRCWYQLHITLVHFAHSGDILTPITSAGIILSHFKII